MLEQAHIFDSRGRKLVAIEHIPLLACTDKPSKKGLVIVVGGPQTRVGSHRLFVSLARELAKQGIHVYRFDYTGAGDSEGNITEFTDIQADIAAAIKHFQQLQPQITELSLWGLCDAASAILLYLKQYPHANVVIQHLVLVNPWVRQAHTQAQTFLKFYYLKRLFKQDFWKKLLTGKISTSNTLAELQDFHQQSQQPAEQNNFVEEMRQGLHHFPGNTSLILSGNDLTADEFTLLVKNNHLWKKAIANTKVDLQTVKQANHTFSTAEDKNKLIAQTLQALLPDQLIK